jgi:hypothetical protein
MIRRSEYGPRCPHCGQVNPAAVVGILAEQGDRAEFVTKCIFCLASFRYWLERLPFFCTNSADPPIACGNPEPSP